LQCRKRSRGCLRRRDKLATERGSLMRFRRSDHSRIETRDLRRAEAPRHRESRRSRFLRWLVLERRPRPAPATVDALPAIRCVRSHRLAGCRRASPRRRPRPAQSNRREICGALSSRASAKHGQLVTRMTVAFRHVPVQQAYSAITTDSTSV
jgi:hypothetical protein